MSELPARYDVWRTREPDVETGPANWKLTVTVKVGVQCAEDDLDVMCDAIEKWVRAALERHGIGGTLEAVMCDDADFVDWVEPDYGRDE